MREAVVHGQRLFVMGIMKAQDDGWRRGAKLVFRDWRRVLGQEKAWSTQTGKSARPW